MYTVRSEAAKQTKVYELEIYDIPQPKYQFQDEEISAFRQFVSQARQSVWNFMDRTKGTYEDATQKYENAKSKAIDTVDYVQNDPGLLPRAGVITVAGLGGLVAGYKRSNFRRALYSGSSMLVVASLCYPNQAVDITRSTYCRTRNFVYEKYTGEKYQPKESSEEDRSGLASIIPSGFYDNFKAVSDKLKGNSKPEPPRNIIIEQAKSIDETPPEEPEKDYGQSNEEDKDLYTTRD